MERNNDTTRIKCLRHRQKKLGKWGKKDCLILRQNDYQLTQRRKNDKEMNYKNTSENTNEDLEGVSE